MTKQKLAIKSKIIVDGAYKAFVGYDVNTTVIYEDERGRNYEQTSDGELEMPRVTVKKDGTDRVTVKKDGTARVTASIEIHLKKPFLGKEKYNFLDVVEQRLMDEDIIVVDGYFRQDDVYELYIADDF